MEFKAEKIGKEIHVKPIIEKKGNDLIIHVPSFRVINNLQRGMNEDGVRHIQSI